MKLFSVQDTTLKKKKLGKNYNTLRLKVCVCVWGGGGGGVFFLKEQKMKKKEDLSLIKSTMTRL